MIVGVVAAYCAAHMFLLADVATATAMPSVPAGFTTLLSAPQHVYSKQVPHTDRNGRPLMSYDPSSSFLPLIVYDPQLDCTVQPKGTGLKPATRLGQGCLPNGFDASLYTRANFTGGLPYPAYGVDGYANAFHKHGLQVIREHPTMSEVQLYKDHPAMLGWYLYEEPTGAQWNLNEPPSNQTKMQRAFDSYVNQTKAIKAVDPIHPVFILDCAWFQPPATEWWTKWNTYGDVTSHDNYPFDYRSRSLATVNGDGGGIPQSVGLAARVNSENKPVWLCVQSFESGNWLMPSPRELRTQVYTGIVHGATGIMYFAMDSYVTRAGGVVGMGPRELLNTSYYDAGGEGRGHGPWGVYHASPALLEMSAAVWEAVIETNTELLELAPVIFAPTSTKQYAVSFKGENVTDTPIRTMLKSTLDGYDILIAVNIDRAICSAAITMEGLGDYVHVMFEQRDVAIVNGTFVDRFDEMDTHVYRLYP